MTMIFKSTCLCLEGEPHDTQCPIGKPLIQCGVCKMDYDPVSSDHALLGACPLDHRIPLSKDFAPRRFKCSRCRVEFDSKAIADGHDCPVPPLYEYDPASGEKHLVIESTPTQEGKSQFEKQWHRMGLAEASKTEEFYQPGKLCTLCGLVFTVEGFGVHICTPSPRASILEEASRLTVGDRNDIHGDPIPAMELFMDLAQPVIDAPNLPKAVRGAMILDAYKTARALHNPFHRDSWVDGCAYKAIAGEAAERSTERPGK